jgi:hypothetical protein
MPKIVLKPLCRGEKLRLRDDTYAPAEVRKWVFYKGEGERIFLEHKTKGYIWKAHMDDIDWEPFQKARASD